MVQFSWKPEALLQEPRCDHTHPAFHSFQLYTLEATTSSDISKLSFKTEPLRA